MTGLQEKTKRRIILILEALKKEHPQGAREIAYTLEASGYIKKTKKEFDAIESACRLGRKKKIIPLDWIVDESRYDYYIPYVGYTGTDDFLTQVKNSIDEYEREFWEVQDNYFELILEKVGIAHFYKPLCEKYHVRLVPIKGDDSYGHINRVIKRYKQRLKEGKKCYLLYLGDFNYKGYSIPFAFRKNMHYFGHFELSDLKYKRIALDFPHILKYPKLPYNPNPEGKTDKNPNGTKSHITMKKEFLELCREQGILGDKNIELEAMKVHHPKEHLTEIEKQFLSLLDMNKWDEQKKLAEEDKKELYGVIENE